MASEIAFSENNTNYSQKDRTNAIWLLSPVEVDETGAVYILLREENHLYSLEIFKI